MGGSSPGDGGAASRKAAEEKRVKNAVAGVNNVFGIYSPVDESTPGQLQTTVRGGRVYASPPSQTNKTNIKKEQARKAVLAGVKAQREGLYSTMGADAKNMALVDLNREREQTARENDFSLARQGLTAGSRDVDSNKLIVDRFNEGVLQAGNAGDTVANNARTADEKTRTNLIASIRAGLDRGSAMQQAYSGMNNNINDARTAATGTNLAGFFNSLQPALQGYQYNSGYNDTMNRLKPGQEQVTPGQAIGKSISKGGYSGVVR